MLPVNAKRLTPEDDILRPNLDSKGDREPVHFPHIGVDVRHKDDLMAWVRLQKANVNLLRQSK